MTSCCWSRCRLAQAKLQPEFSKGIKKKVFTDSSAQDWFKTPCRSPSLCIRAGRFPLGLHFCAANRCTQARTAHLYLAVVVTSMVGASYRQVSSQQHRLNLCSEVQLRWRPLQLDSSLWNLSDQRAPVGNPQMLRRSFVQGQSTLLQQAQSS